MSIIMDNVLKIRMSKGPDINRYLRLLRTPGTFADAQMICLKNSDAEYFTCNTICLPNKLRANVMIPDSPLRSSQASRCILLKLILVNFLTKSGNSKQCLFPRKKPTIFQIFQILFWGNFLDKSDNYKHF